MSNDDIAQRLSSIQTQLAKLQTDYGSMASALYDIFFNTDAKDVTLRMYNKNGELVDVTLPNRAKDATDKVLTCAGNPEVLEVEAKQLGVLCIDTDKEDLYYYTRDGWIKVWSSSNFESGLDFIEPESDASSLKNLNMKNAMRYSALPVVSGGTGTTDLGKGILKAVPAVTGENGEEKSPAYVTIARAGADYIDVDSFVGMVCFALSTDVPDGFLICNGASYRVVDYEKLFTYLRDNLGIESFIDQQGDERFEVPDLRDLYPKFVDPSTRTLLDVEEPALPNIKGAWAQEITGIDTDNYFTGAVYVKRGEDEKPIQVPGKTSSPGGYYDYAIGFSAANYNNIYKDDVDEVRVKNVALLPVIKY